MSMLCGLVTVVAWALSACFGPLAPVDDDRSGDAPPDTPHQDVGPLPDADVRVLFIGNSLTASNDLPGMVDRIAEAAGRTFEYRMVLRGGSSLEDHWNLGVERVILDARADFVVMQQGPSSVGGNPAYLRAWTDTLTTAIRAAGGEPALLMVWPESTRQEAFDAVRDSYAGAAAAVGGVFVPAGESWREIWARDADATLYGADGFHPSPAGSFAAAVTVFAVLFGEDPTELPAPLPGVDDAELIYEAVQAAVAATAAP